MGPSTRTLSLISKLTSNGPFAEAKDSSDSISGEEFHDVQELEMSVDPWEPDLKFFPEVRAEPLKLYF